MMTCAASVGILALLIGIETVSGTQSYDYFHQDKWGGQCQTGLRQSPINIRTDNLTPLRASAPNIVFHWNHSPIGMLQNNGHTVQFTPNDGQPVAYTETFLGQYQLKQAHMHWGENDVVGSEHRINGEQASLEIHFVHKKVAPPNQNEHLVVAIMADAGSERDDSVFDYLPLHNIQRYNAQIHTNLPYDLILPPRSHSYYYYVGSLTTPKCSESVQWFVMKDRITVPRSYLARLRTMHKDTAGNWLQFNYRDPQPLNCRFVFHHENPVCQ